MARCSDGFSGAYLSRCTTYGWTKSSGKCVPSASAAAAVVVAQGAVGAAPVCTAAGDVPSSCYPKPTTCWGYPPGPNPPGSNASFWPVLFASENERMAVAECKSGFVGHYVSVCVNDNWSLPVGGCYKDPNMCWGPPKAKVAKQEDCE